MPLHRRSRVFARPPGRCRRRTCHNWGLLIMAESSLAASQTARAPCCVAGVCATAAMHGDGARTVVGEECNAGVFSPPKSRTLPERLACQSRRATSCPRLRRRSRPTIRFATLVGNVSDFIGTEQLPRDAARTLAQNVAIDSDITACARSTCERRASSETRPSVSKPGVDTYF